MSADPTWKSSPGRRQWSTKLRRSYRSSFQIVVPVGARRPPASGTALAAPAQARVLGIQAAASRAVPISMTACRVVDADIHNTIADGLAGNIAHDAITPQILSENHVPMAAVMEEAIYAAVRELALQYGIVAEGSAGVGIAAARTGQVPADLPTVFVITGRNIAADRLARWSAREIDAAGVALSAHLSARRSRMVPGSARPAAGRSPVQPRRKERCCARGISRGAASP